MVMGDPSVRLRMVILWLTFAWCDAVGSDPVRRKSDVRLRWNVEWIGDQDGRRTDVPLPAPEQDGHAHTARMEDKAHGWEDGSEPHRGRRERR